jgi:phage baseplate assembly protein W
MVYFRGWEAPNDPRDKNFELVDIPLVKRSLMNHFNTRIGERVMRPDWGCRIWNYLAEPFVQSTKDAIVAEAMRIVDAQKGRVRLDYINVVNYEYGVRIEMTLTYVPEDVIDNYTIEFNREQLSMNV